VFRPGLCQGGEIISFTRMERGNAYHQLAHSIIYHRLLHTLLPPSTSRKMVRSRADLVLGDGVLQIVEESEHIFTPLNVVSKSL